MEPKEYEICKAPEKGGFQWNRGGSLIPRVVRVLIVSTNIT
jgi:hypothetical protein